jgi:hypothetical protein
MNHLDKISLYNRAASRAFHNAVGDEAITSVAQALDLNDRTLTVQIAPISSTVAGTARIFGANLDLDETYNTANNMTVTVPESSHKVVKSQSMGNAYRIKGLLYTVSSALQLANPFNIIQQSFAGGYNSRQWQPSKYTSPTNYNALMIKTSDFQVVIDGETRIEIAFLAGATASLVLSIQDKMDLSQALSGRTPLKSAAK